LGSRQADGRRAVVAVAPEVADPAAATAEADPKIVAAEPEAAVELMGGVVGVAAQVHGAELHAADQVGAEAIGATGGGVAGSSSSDAPSSGAQTAPPGASSTGSGRGTASPLITPPMPSPNAASQPVHRRRRRRPLPATGREREGRWSRGGVWFFGREMSGEETGIGEAGGEELRLGVVVKTEPGESPAPIPNAPRCIRDPPSTK